jgi:hypothetical protein
MMNELLANLKKVKTISKSGMKQCNFFQKKGWSAWISWAGMDY